MFKRTRISRITNPCGVLSLLIAYEPKVAKAIARISSGWNSCYSPLIKKYSSSMEIRVIREIRVL